jgi:uncharacterized membrane protein
VSRILLAGESWTTTSTHTKGFDSFVTSSYAEGGGDFISALRGAGHAVTYLPNHVAAAEFPATQAGLGGYDVVVLSDIGANTLLLHPDTFLHGRARPNALAALARWVYAGGALLMVGGYLSFQGIEGRANYARTTLADVLPVIMESGDDREETPQGVAPQVLMDNHPVVSGLPSTWPEVLGFQRVTAKPEATTLVQVDGYPLVVVGRAGAGRSMAFTSDMGPHWIPEEFISWPGYALFWQQAIGWLCESRAEANGAATDEPSETVLRS